LKYSALKIQCHIVKNTLLHTAIRRFCPLGTLMHLVVTLVIISYE